MPWSTARPLRPSVNGGGSHRIGVFVAVPESVSAILNKRSLLMAYGVELFALCASMHRCFKRS